MRTPAFVGRTDELQALQTTNSAVYEGNPGFVLVDAPPGGGKTALLGQFRTRLKDELVIAAGSDGAESGLPFGLLQQLGMTGPFADPLAAGASFLRWLSETPTNKTTALLLDDVHGADPESLRALTFALRRLRHDRVLVVMTTRSEQVHLLPPGLLQLMTERGQRLTLEGLSESDIVDLAQAQDWGRMSARAAERVHRLTGGVPLHLVALLREVSLADIEAADDALPAPRSFALLVLGELAGASGQAQAFAAAAAVLGERCSTGDALAVAELDWSSAAQVIDELHAARILHAVPGRSQDVRFDHPLIRAAVYGDLSTVHRTQLHSRAGQMLSGPSSLQHRIRASAGPDQSLVEELTLAASEQRKLGNLAGAASWLLAASRCSGPGPDGDRALLEAVELLLVAGDVIGAATHSAHVASLAPSAQQLSVLARLAWLTGQADEAAQLSRQAWQRSSELDPAARDQLAAMLAQIEIQRDRGAEAADWASQALGDGLLEAEEAPHTRAAQAFALCLSGEAEQGLRHLDWLPDNPSHVDADHQPELAARGILRMTVDDLTGAEADLRVVGAQVHRDFAPFRLAGLGVLVETLFRSGDWAASQAFGDQVVSLTEDMGQPWLAGFLHSVVSHAWSGRGDWAAARKHVDAATTVASTLHDPVSRSYADDASVFLATCRHEPDEVVRAAARLRLITSGPAVEPGIVAWQVHLASALIELGRLDEAGDIVEPIHELAIRRGRRSRLAAVARVRGELAAARRDNALARDAFEEALSLGRGAADELEQAMARAAYGRFLRRRGERRAAVEQLQDARARFAALRASPFLARCDSELADCGVDTANAKVVDVLTPQERVVAELVATGRTNQQIADQLVLSVKTVNYHLSNVYLKLNVHNRVQLAARLSG